MRNSRFMRVISLVLCAMMVLALLPQPALATANDAPSGAQGGDTTNTGTGGSESSATPTPITDDGATGQDVKDTPAPTVSVSPDEIAPPVVDSSAEGTPTPEPSITPDPSLLPEASITPEVSATPEIKEYTVIFLVNGVEDEDLTTTVKAGGTVSQPADPAVPDEPDFYGLAFLYWATAGGESYNFEAEVADNLTLNAVFGEAAPVGRMALAMVAAPATYAVNYAAGASGVTDLPANESTVEAGATYTLSGTAPKRDGYIFTNWSTSDVTGSAQTYAAGASFTMPSNDVTLTANWRVNNVVVIHVYSGTGTSHPIQTYTMNDVSADDLSDYASLSNITLVNRLQDDTDYAFAGYKTYIKQKDLVGDGKVGLSADGSVDNKYHVYIHINSNNFYDITYKLNGGTNDPNNPATFTKQSGTITLAPATRTGYTFTGWWPNDGVIPAGYDRDITFTAFWSGPIAYKINYVLNGGINDLRNPTSYTVETKTFTLKDPSKIGYTFDGWTPDDGEIRKGSTGEKTFTATWTPISYPITYDLNGGENNDENPESYTIESGLITLKAPTKDGYAFLGWSLTNSIPANSIGPRSFTALWSLPLVYSIKYELAGGANHPTNPTVYTVLTPTFSLKAPTRTGYTFAGWTPDNGVVAQGSFGDKTFTATWTPISYAITYNLNGGQNNSENPATYTADSGLITLKDPTKAGYTFLRWEEGNTIPAGSTGARTFTATWSDPVVYRINYELDGGRNDISNPTGYTVLSALITLKDPTKTGYTFLRWEEGSTIPAGSTGDKTFTAIWSDPIEYGITYNLGGGENNSDNPATYTVASGLITLKDPTKAGYTFLRWEEGSTIPAGSTGAKTFTAQWSEPVEYGITYNLDGGVNHDDNPATYTVLSGQITLKEPTKAGYTFEGWSEGNTIPAGSTGDKTFTAQWSDPIEYGITYNLDGGVNHDDNPATYTVLSGLITLKDPTKTGYSFTRWEEGNYIPAGSTGSRNFTATWSGPIVYDIEYDLDHGVNNDANPKNYTVNSPLIQLLEPTRPGYYFLGWSPTDQIPAGSTGTQTFVANWAQKTALTLTANSLSVTYNGKEQSVSGFTSDIGGLTFENVTAGAKGTKANEYTVDFVNQSGLVIKDGDGNDVTEQYTVTFVPGKLTIAKAELTVTAGNRSMTYGNTYSLTPAASVVYSGFVNGETATSAHVTGTVSYAYYSGTTPVTISRTLGAGLYAIRPGVSALSAENYTFVPVDGTLTVNQATGMKVYATGISHPYDGNGYSISARATITSGTTYLYSTVGGADLSQYSATKPMIKNVSESKIIYVAAVNQNYVTAFDMSTVTITPRSITLSSGSDSKTYDGKPLTKAAVTQTGTFAKDEGFVEAVVASGTITNAGSTANTIVLPELKDNTLAENYRIRTTEGTLTVRKAILTATAGNRSMTYGNMSTLAPAESVTYSGFVNGESVDTIVISGSVSYDYYFTLIPVTVNETLSAGTYSIHPDIGDLSAQNYSFAPANGTLTVSKSDLLTVTAEPYAGKYDGMLHWLSPVANVPGGTLFFYSLTGGAYPGDYRVLPYGALNVSDSKTIYIAAVNSNYETAYTSATLTITKRDITLTSESATKMYNGTALTKPGVTIGGDGFIRYQGFGSNPTAIGNIVDVGSTANTIKAPSYNALTNAGNYNIIKNEGTLTITPSNLLQATATPYTGQYDGGEHTIGAGANITTGTTLLYSTTGGTDLSAYAAAKPTVKNVADSKTIYVAAVNANYETSFASAAVTLSKRSIQLTSDTASKEYDKLPLERPALTISGDDFAPGEGFETTPVASGSIIEVGEKTNTIVIPALKGNTLEGNYTIGKTEGTLTITASDALSVEATGYSGLYDGTARQISAIPSEEAGTTLLYSTVGGTDLTNYSADNPSIKNVADSKTVYVAAVNSNYITAFDSAAITLTQRAISLTSASASKDYDALPLMNTAVVSGGDGFAPQEGFETEPVASGTIIDPGTTANTIVIPAMQPNTLQGNYDVQTTEGTLTVRPRVTYSANTTDNVAGIPATAWFDYLGSATIADATGVVRTGYVLTGWQDRSTGEAVALGETISPINRNYDLLAVWAFDVYDTTFDDNTVDAVTNMPVSILNKAYTSSVTLPALEPGRADYNFVGWRTYDIDGTMTTLAAGDTFTMPANDVTFQAIWQIIISPVLYAANGGVGATYTEGYYPTNDNVTVAGNQFTRTGYRFLGWGTGANSGVVYTAGDTFVMPAEAVTLYAQWEQLLYTVSYFVTGGTQAGLDGETPYATYANLPLGAQMPIPDDPSEEGFEFDGWTSVIPATVPEGGVTIYGSMSRVSTVLESIESPNVPLAAPAPSWSIFNLIMTIATAIASGAMIAGLLKKSNDLVGGRGKKRAGIRFSTLAPAIGAILAFILTQNMSNTGTMFDKWSPMMAGIGAVQGVLTALGIKMKPRM